MCSRIVPSSATDAQDGLHAERTVVRHRAPEPVAAREKRDLDRPAAARLCRTARLVHDHEQTAKALVGVESVLLELQPALVVVPGDVNSTLAASLVAAKGLIPLAHIESGLRSFDPTMPEEVNRIVTDRLSDYLFLHSDEAVENLRAEGSPTSACTSSATR